MSSSRSQGATSSDALAAAHEQGIVHRDLKPGNVTAGATLPFWSPDGRWIGSFTGERLHKISEVVPHAATTLNGILPVKH